MFGWEVMKMREVYTLWLDHLVCEVQTAANTYESSGGRVEGISDALEASQLAINALRKVHEEQDSIS